MTDVERPQIGQEAWIKERYFSRTAIFKGKVVKVTPTLQVVVEYETGKASPDSPGKVLRQLRFKPSRWRASTWDHMEGGGYSQSSYTLATGSELTEALKLEWRREAAKSRSSRRVRAALVEVQGLQLDDRHAQIGLEKLKAAKAKAEEFIATLNAAIELQEMPEPTAQQEDDE